MDIAETVMKYRQMEKAIPGSSMIREVMWQYADMAKGGDGGPLHIGNDPDNETCRRYNYPDKSDAFFQEVCDLLGWNW